MYNIEWINYKPVDEPHCGYDGSKCPRPGGLTETLAAVLGGMLIIILNRTLNYQIILIIKFFQEFYFLSWWPMFSIIADGKLNKKLRVCYGELIKIAYKGMAGCMLGMLNLDKV